MESQSPQAGQFNSYIIDRMTITIIVNRVSIPSSGSIQFLPQRRLKMNHEEMVSIPSSGSIQFLLRKTDYMLQHKLKGLNPLKRVNSILTILLYG